MNQDDNKKTKIAAGLGFMSVNRIDALVKNSSSIRRMTLPILANNHSCERKAIGQRDESAAKGDFVKQQTRSRK